MNKVTILIMLLATTPVAAQSAPLALDAFLEQRVVEELAADGTMLSRVGLALDVEAVGDKLLVSLVDPTTRRVVASTKVDSVPADREAAVAAVTQITANLVAQVGARSEPAPAPAIDVAHDVRQQLDAEWRYRQEMVSFESELSVSSDKTGTRVSSYKQPVLGELKRPLHGRDFYIAVDRPDLADQYSSRKRRMWIGLLGGTALGIGGLYLISNNLGAGTSCDSSSPLYDQCRQDYDDRHRPMRLVGTTMAIAGGVGVIGGIYYLFRRHPVGLSEWYDLAEAHNAKVRRKYGLTATSARALRKHERTFDIAPYAVGDGAGLFAFGRF